MEKTTKVLMADRSIKEMKDLKIGDLLCGDDNLPRIVNDIEYGNDMMYLVEQYKGNQYMVNEDVILMFRATGVAPSNRQQTTGYKWFMLSYFRKCTDITCSTRTCSKVGLKMKTLNFASQAELDIAKVKLLNGELDPTFVRDGDIFEISLSDYNQLCSKAQCKIRLKGYKSPFPSFQIMKRTPLPIDPYLLGLWLGDGDSKAIQITSVDKEIDTYLNQFVLQYEFMKLVKTTVGSGTRFFYWCYI